MPAFGRGWLCLFRLRSTDRARPRDSTTVGRNGHHQLIKVTVDINNGSRRSRLRIAYRVGPVWHGQSTSESIWPSSGHRLAPGTCHCGRPSHTKACSVGRGDATECWRQTVHRPSMARTVSSCMIIFHLNGNCRTRHTHIVVDYQFN